MKSVSKYLLAALLAAGAATLLFADTFVMKDGRRIEGKVARETGDSYFVTTGVGEVELKKADVTERIAGKTPRDLYDEQWAKAKTGADFASLGTWATDQKLKTLAQKAWKRALELEPQNEVANKGVGNVLYKGAWMTPAERDKRAAGDEEAEMLAKGLVRYQDRWVTPDEKSKLEQGLVLFEGKWMTVPEAKRKQGLEEFEGAWMPKAEALARGDVAAVAKIVGHPLKIAVNAEAAIAGDYDVPVLEQCAHGVEAGRAWFDHAYKVEPGLALLGNRLAEFYLWNRDNAPYVNTVDHFASLTPTVGPSWAEAVKQTHGFFWVDPYAVSSARVWNRPDEDLLGHCIHHWGHMMVERLGYDGRLLPPWYDEGVASVTEYRVYAHNAVFCRAQHGPKTEGGTSAPKVETLSPFEASTFRNGKWLPTLKDALGKNQIPSFDKLSDREFSELDLVDIASSMGIVSWLESRGPDALAKFQAELRRTQPKAPDRILQPRLDRLKVYDQAFKLATGVSGWKEADATWRTWMQTQ